MPFATLEDLYGPLGLDARIMAKMTQAERLAAVETRVEDLILRFDRFEDNVLKAVKANGHGNGTKRQEMIYLGGIGLVGAIVVLAQVIDRLVA